MVTYKEYIQRLRNLELETAHIELLEDLSPDLKKMIQQLLQIEFRETHIYAYYKDIKRVIEAFIHFWESTTEEYKKASDDIIGSVLRDEYQDLIDRTINIQQNKQVDFGKQFLPVKSSNEKYAYDEILKNYDIFINNLNAKKDKLQEIPVQKHYSDIVLKVDFIKEDMETCLRVVNSLFDFTHTFIATFLLERITLIRESFEKLSGRIRKNIQQLKDSSEKRIDALRNHIYEKNKELYSEQKKEKNNSLEIYELEFSIKTLKETLEDEECSSKMTTDQLEEEVEYWQQKTKNMDEIVDVINKMGSELNLTLQEYAGCLDNLFDQKRPLHERQCCLQSISEYYNAIKQYLNCKILKSTKSLVALFANKGFPRQLFKHIKNGSYYFDIYGNKIFLGDHGLQFYRKKGKDLLKEIFLDHDIIYEFDETGRFYCGKSGEKIYIRDPTRIKEGEESAEATDKEEILPDGVEPIDIKSTLDKETVKYLWDSFGDTLPDALADVEERRPENPIPYLARRMLAHKYRREESVSEMKELESWQYRRDAKKAATEKIEQFRRVWKAKQVKRRKPEESDDTDHWQAYYYQLSNQEFVNAINTDFLYNNTVFY